MDDKYPPEISTQDKPVTPAMATAGLPPWQASLSLGFKEKNGRSILCNKRHHGPLVVQKVLYPEGDAVCQGIIVHPPGGIAGGDVLKMDVRLDSSAHVLLTTPGASKWYKANGREASQQLKFDLETGANLEWLPQENILFDGAMPNLSTTVNLASGAAYAGWEVLCFGRQASNEPWLRGQFKQRLQILRNYRLIWQECAFLQPESRVFTAQAGLCGNVVSGSFVVAAGLVPDDLLNTCRSVTAEAYAKVAVTALPEIFSARYLGLSSQSARQYFEALWQILRPWYAGRPVCRPRIWNT